MVRRPAAKPGPVPPRTLAAVGLHRVVVRMNTPPPPPDQRERVDDRAGPGFAMEVVKAAQNALAMGGRGQRITAARRRLPRHRVGHPSPDHGSAGRNFRLARIAWIARATGLDGDLDPPAEVPGLGPGRLIPQHRGRPQEPVPAQQRDRICAQRGRSPRQERSPYDLWALKRYPVEVRGTILPVTDLRFRPAHMRVAVTATPATPPRHATPARPRHRQPRGPRALAARSSRPAVPGVKGARGVAARALRAPMTPAPARASRQQSRPRGQPGTPRTNQD